MSRSGTISQVQSRCACGPHPETCIYSSSSIRVQNNLVGNYCSIGRVVKYKAIHRTGRRKVGSGDCRITYKNVTLFDMQICLKCKRRWSHDDIIHCVHVVCRQCVGECECREVRNLPDVQGSDVRRRRSHGRQVRHTIDIQCRRTVHDCGIHSQVADVQRCNVCRLGNQVAGQCRARRDVEYLCVNIRNGECVEKECRVGRIGGHRSEHVKCVGHMDVRNCDGV